MLIFVWRNFRITTFLLYHHHLNTYHTHTHIVIPPIIIMPAAPADLVYNTPQEITQAHQELRDSFASGVTYDVGFRKHQLKQLSFLLNDNVDAISDAIAKDLGRCKFESVFAEIMLTTNSVLDAHNQCEKWSKDEKIWSGAIWALHHPTIRKDPKGTVLVIGAWNYPISVQIGPMIGALAAGCTVVLKPSEVAAHSARLLAELWPKYMDPRMSRVINGGVQETTQLLDLQWEHIMYTGNGTVGRIVAEKAAKWLCPTTLELGGKSPVVVDDDADFNIAAHRILWAKIVNVGQTCIAPDYVLVTEKSKEKLLDSMKKVVKEYFPNGNRQSPDFGRVINDRQFKRLAGILERTKAKVAIGGHFEAPERYMDLTVLSNVQPGDAAMEGEIFGPILPIMSVPNVQGAIDYINANDRPLATYVFASKQTTNDIIKKTRSGGLVDGDLLLQYVVEDIGFGGTGNSGYGSYHGKAGFDTFTHSRGCIHAPSRGLMGQIAEKALSTRYPPYKDSNLSFMRLLMGKTPNFSRPEKVYNKVSN